MASRAATIADALADWLNASARDWSMDGWKAKRTWQPLTDLAATDILDVQVCADSRTGNERANRAKLQRDVSIEIHFRQVYQDTGTIPEEWIDERVELVEEIDDELNHLTLSVGTAFFSAIMTTNINPLCDAIDIHEMRQFTATIEVTVREIKTQ